MSACSSSSRILDTRQVWEIAGRFPYFTRVIRLTQDLYDRIYLGDVARDQIKGELDATQPRPAAQTKLTRPGRIWDWTKA